MKLAEALVIRSDLQNKINDLEIRLENNATVQNGESPAEDPKSLLALLDETLVELERLIGAINLTNASVQKDGKTMTEMLAKRDCLKLRMGIIRNFLNTASIPGHRTRANEILVKSTIPVSEMQKNVDKQSAELRKLELEIQALNWTSNLLE